MHHQTRDDRIRSPIRKAPSRSSSLGSDRSHSSRSSVLQAPPIVSPPPAFVALSAASQAATDAQAARLYDVDDAASIASADYQQAIFTERALAMINGFLDQILYSSLATARGTTLALIRPATEQILKGKLAREAFAAAEEELEDLLAGADENDPAESPKQPASPSFDHELVWKRTRLRVMVYTRLGEMEDDDEERFIDEGQLYDDRDAKTFSADAGLVSWAAAIFMTSILEFIAEQCIFIAGNAAFDRHNSRTQDADAANASGTGDDRVTITEHDVEKIALNPVLNRLWRTWRKGLRQSRSFAVGGPAHRKSPSARMLTHKKSRSEVAKSASTTPILPKRQHSFSAFSTPAQSLGIVPPSTRALQRRRSHGDVPFSHIVKQAIAKDKAKRRRSLPPNNAALLSTASMRGFQTHPPATIGPKLGHFRSSRNAESPRAESPVTPSSARHASIFREPKPMSPRTSVETTRGPRELKLAAKQFSNRSSPDLSATTPPPLHSEIKRLSGEKPAPVPEEPVAEAPAVKTTAPATPATSATAPVERPDETDARRAPVKAPVDVPLVAPVAVPMALALAPTAVSPLELRSSSPGTKVTLVPQDQTAGVPVQQPQAVTQESIALQSAVAAQSSAVPKSQPVQQPTIVQAIPVRDAAIEQSNDPSSQIKQPTSSVQQADAVQQQINTQDSPTLHASTGPRQSNKHDTATVETSTPSSARPSEDTARKPATLPRLSTQSTGSVWSSQSGNSDRPYVSRFMEGSPVLEKTPDAARFSASSTSPSTTRKHDSATSETMVTDPAWRKKKYVDPDAFDRASVQRLSTSSSVRLSKTPEALRTRDMSASSLASRVREGAESRQSINSSGAHSEAMERDFDDLIAGAEPVKYTLTPGALRKLESPVESPSVSTYSQTPTASSGKRLSAALSSFTSSQAAKSPPGSFSAHMAARDGNPVLAPISEPKTLVTSSSRPPQAKPSNVGVPRDARAVAPSTREMSDFLKSSQPNSPAAHVPSAPLEPIGEVAHSNRYVSAPTSTRVSRRPSFSSPADTDEPRPASNGNAGPPSGVRGSSSVKKKAYVPRDPVVRRVDQDDLISFLREGPARSSTTGSGAARGTSSVISSGENRSSGATTFSHPESFNSQSRLVGPAPVVKKQSRVRDMYSTDFVDEDDEDLLLAMDASGNSNHEQTLIDFLKTSSPPETTKKSVTPAPAAAPPRHVASNTDSRSASPLPSAGKSRRPGWFSRSSSRDRVPQQQSSIGQLQISSTPPMLPMPGYLSGAGEDTNYEARPTPTAAPAPGVNRSRASKYNAPTNGYATEREAGKKMPFWKRLGTAY